MKCVIGGIALLVGVGCGGRVDTHPTPANVNGANPIEGASGAAGGSMDPTSPVIATGGSTPSSPGDNPVTSTNPPSWNDPPSNVPPLPAKTPPDAPCWYGQLPPEIQPILPKLTIAEACRGTSYPTPNQGMPPVADLRSRLVGRWIACGTGGLSMLAHTGIEFGPNARWRLLTTDPSGALVPMTMEGAHGRYAAPTDQQLDLRDEGYEGVVSGTFFISYSNGLDAFQIGGDRNALSTYARTNPAPNNGRDNVPSVTDGICSMVGDWDVPANTVTPMVPAATLSFDAQGNFVGGPQGSDLCAGHTMYGTYRLSKGLFQITTNVGMGLCQFWSDAGYPAEFDPGCTKLTTHQTFDNCTGGRGYFNGTITIVKRQ
jgi:hypothetical protein